MAGLGGNTIRGILSDAPQVLAMVKRLVLQPMTDAGDLRLWLVSHGWKITDEHLIEDEGRIYVVIVAEHGYERIEHPVLLELGPRLLEKGSPLLGHTWTVLLSNMSAYWRGLPVPKAMLPEKRLRLLGEVS